MLLWVKGATIKTHSMSVLLTWPKYVTMCSYLSSQYVVLGSIYILKMK